MATPSYINALYHHVQYIIIDDLMYKVQESKTVEQILQMITPYHLKQCVYSFILITATARHPYSYN